MERPPGTRDHVGTVRQRGGELREVAQRTGWESRERATNIVVWIQEGNGREYPVGIEVAATNCLANELAFDTGRRCKEGGIVTAFDTEMDPCLIAEARVSRPERLGHTARDG